MGGVAWCGRGGSTRSLEVGDGAPPLLRPTGRAPLLITWVIRAQDCLTCRTPSRALRRWSGIPMEAAIQVVVVGRGEDRVRAFLEAERIVARVSRLNRGAHRKMFGRASVPALYVVRHDTVIAVWVPAARPVGFAVDSIDVQQGMSHEECACPEGSLVPEEVQRCSCAS